MALGTTDPVNLEQTLLMTMVKRDWIAFDRMLAREFVFASNVHRRKSRDEWIALVKQYQFIDARVRNLSDLMFGDTMIIHAQLTLNVLVGGQPHNGLHDITDIWVEQEGRWRIVSRTSIQRS